MLIVRKGSINERWLAKCSSCSSIIEAETSELDVIKGDYRSDYEEFAWKDCPVCEKKHALCFHKEGTKGVEVILNELKKVSYITVNTKRK
jgi:hypothetical protein